MLSSFASETSYMHATASMNTVPVYNYMCDTGAADGRVQYSSSGVETECSGHV